MTLIFLEHQRKRIQGIQMGVALLIRYKHQHATHLSPFLRMKRVISPLCLQQLRGETS